jgi:hypothetical protein
MMKRSYLSETYNDCYVLLKQDLKAFGYHPAKMELKYCPNDPKVLSTDENHKHFRDRPGKYKLYCRQCTSFNKKSWNRNGKFQCCVIAVIELIKIKPTNHDSDTFWDIKVLQLYPHSKICCNKFSPQRRDLIRQNWTTIEFHFGNIVGDIINDFSPDTDITSYAPPFKGLQLELVRKRLSILLVNNFGVAEHLLQFQHYTYPYNLPIAAAATNITPTIQLNTQPDHSTVSIDNETIDDCVSYISTPITIVLPLASEVSVNFYISKDGAQTKKEVNVKRGHILLLGGDVCHDCITTIANRGCAHTGHFPCLQFYFASTDSSSTIHTRTTYSALDVSTPSPPPDIIKCIFNDKFNDIISLCNKCKESESLSEEIIELITCNLGRLSSFLNINTNKRKK